MVVVVDESPISQRPRKALQPKNSSCFESKPNVKADWGVVDENNKENAHLLSSKPKPKPKPRAGAEAKKECFQIDASLAEELSAIREKLERLRIDKEKTDKMLRERAAMLDSQLKVFVDRGMLQKQLEIEVDRLFRLKEIKLSCTCTTISPLRSLRQKEQEKTMQLKASCNRSENSSPQNQATMDIN